MLNNIQRMTLNVRDGIDSTKDVALKVNDQVESLRLDSRRKAIRRWLSAPDPSTNYQRGCRSRHEMTGTWFTQSEAFERWKMDENTILWLHGKPGCGKTVLCSTIITDILCQCEASSQSSVAYFFFDFNSSEKQMSSQMVRSIMTQLPGRSINALAQVESLFASCSEGQRQPDNEGLMEILQANMQEYSHTFVILDALDECSDLEELLTLISEIESWKLPTLHLLFTSRRLTTIEETLRGLTKSTNMIEIQSKLVDMDISNYVSERLRVDKRLQRWNKRPDIKEEIRSTLATKADGMYIHPRDFAFRITVLLTQLHPLGSVGLSVSLTHFRSAPISRLFGRPCALYQRHWTILMPGYSVISLRSIAITLSQSCAGLHTLSSL